MKKFRLMTSASDIIRFLRRLGVLVDDGIAFLPFLPQIPCKNHWQYKKICYFTFGNHDMYFKVEYI